MFQNNFSHISFAKKAILLLSFVAFIQTLVYFVFFVKEGNRENPSYYLDETLVSQDATSKRRLSPSSPFLQEAPKNNQLLPLPLDAKAFIENKIQGMSLSQKVGQLIHIGMLGKKAKGQVLSDIRRFHPGGIILFEANFSNKDSIKKLTQGLQKAAIKSGGIPLFLSTDQEGGRVFRLEADSTEQFPGAMAMGQADDPVLAREAGFVTGYELGRLGLRLIFAPVLDINSNPDNPVIQTRSFGSTKERVVRNAIPFMQGLQTSLSVPVIKHFPGHGDTHTDSHLALPVIQKTLSLLEKEELVPFQKAIDKGADALMSAHILFPKIDPKAPATLSSILLQQLLRKKMGFRGLVISDALEMKAVSDRYGYGELGVQAVSTGVDVLLLTSTGKILEEMHSALLHAFQTGRLKESDLNASLQRQLYLKLKADLFSESETQKLSSLALPARRVAADLFYKHLSKKYQKLGFSLNRLISRKSIRSLGKSYNLYYLISWGKDNLKNEFTEKQFWSVARQGNKKKWILGTPKNGSARRQDSSESVRRAPSNMKTPSKRTIFRSALLYYKSGILFDEALLRGFLRKNLKKLKPKSRLDEALVLEKNAVFFVEFFERDLPAWNRLVKIANKSALQSKAGSPILVGLYAGNPFRKIQIPKRGAVLASFSPTAESRRALLYQAIAGKAPKAALTTR